MIQETSIKNVHGQKPKPYVRPIRIQVLKITSLPKKLRLAPERENRLNMIFYPKKCYQTF